MTTNLDKTLSMRQLIYMILVSQKEPYLNEGSVEEFFQILEDKSSSQIPDLALIL